MKKPSNPARRAAWLLAAAPAFLTIPAAAQETPTPPPPVTSTVPQASTPAPAPTSQTPPPSRETGRPVTTNTVDPQSRTTIAPGAADVVDDARIAAPRTARTAPARPAPRATTRTATATRAPAAATPAALAAPEPTPAATAPATQPAETTPAPTAATPADTTASPATDTGTATTADTQATTTTTTQDNGVPLWPLGVVVALIVAAGAFFLMRRRRTDEAYVEEAYAEPEYVEPVAERDVVAEPAYVAPAAAVAAAPVAATPAMDREPVVDHAAGLAEEATVTDAPAEDVAALTDGAAPVRNRPWLEFAMRPVRAGTTADEAMVEIELTVANSGNVAAQDVRVSTFMLTDTHASEMERMMVDAPADAAIDPVTIAPGEGTRIDATLAALKSDLGAEGHFNPVVVAEARYRLPDGSEGRTAASFVVGVTDDENAMLRPIDLADRVMREDIEAQLHGEVEHA